MAGRLADHVHAQLEFLAFVLGQVTVQALVDHAVNPDHQECPDNEIPRQNGVWDEWIKGLVGEVIRVIERVSALLKCRKPREKHQCRGVKQKDRLVGIGWPSQA